MIEVQNLTKYFGPTLAVDHVSFRVAKGEIDVDAAAAALDAQRER